MSRTPDDGDVQRETRALAGAHTLEIERGPGGDSIRICNAGGGALLVQISERGLEVRLEGVDLTLATTGEIALDAERLRLRGRSGVTIESEGGLSLRAEEQRLDATRGSVRVRASDDVALDGERVLLNCPERQK